MSNTINLIVELGPESQAKLDKILAALEGIKPNCHSCVETAVSMTKNAIEATEHPADDVSPHGEPEPVAEPAEKVYKVTKADITAKVQALAAPNNPKREQVKALVKSYGAKVSDIPEDKYDEVMDKLVELED